eukprot:6477846-Amphidinium_carterae.1
MPRHYFEAIKGPTQVSSLPDKVQKLFTGPHGSRWKESESVSVGLRALSEGEAQAVEKSMKGRMLTSRWLDVWKLHDEEQSGSKEVGLTNPCLGAKSRWILQGYKDPDLMENRSSVPSPEGHELLWVLFSIASRKWLASA